MKTPDQWTEEILNGGYSGESEISQRDRISEVVEKIQAEMVLVIGQHCRVSPDAMLQAAKVNSLPTLALAVNNSLR